MNHKSWSDVYPYLDIKLTTAASPSLTRITAASSSTPSPIRGPGFGCALPFHGRALAPFVVVVVGLCGVLHRVCVLRSDPVKTEGQSPTNRSSLKK